MIDILVVRGDGLRQGEDIEDPLLSSIEVALARGRNEIDANSGLQEVVVEATIKPSSLPGELAEVHDALMGRSWRGKVSGVHHRYARNSATTTFTLERIV